MTNWESYIASKTSPSIVLIAGSAGAFDGLLKLIENIPKDTKAYWVLLLHRNGKYKTNLVSLLQYHSSIKVKEAEDKEPLEVGIVYVAPASYHLLLEKTLSWSLEAGEPVWHCKPAIDVLFDSVADAMGASACGILLSGANQDGANGLKSIKDKGGISLIQSPDDAMYPTMPSSAKQINAVGAEFEIKDIPNLINQLFKSST